MDLPLSSTQLFIAYAMPLVLLWLAIRQWKKDELVEDEQGQTVRKGLGGWLFLLGLLVLGISLVQGISLLQLPDILQDEIYKALTDPESVNYQPYFELLHWMGVGVGSLIFVGSLAALYLFYSKKLLFPKFFIALVSANFVLMLLDFWAVELVFANGNMFGPENIRSLIIALAYVVIWTPYLMISKRVKATFVN